MARAGWIKLHRGLLDWEWYHDPNTLRVFLHLLLTANFEDNEYMGVKLKRGQCIISVRSLAEELQLTLQHTRTALKHLISTQEITLETTHRFSVVTIANYELYQGVEPCGQTVDNSEPNTATNTVANTVLTQSEQKSNTVTNKPTLYTKNYKELLSKNDKNNARARGDEDEEKKMSKAMRDVMMFRRMCEDDSD